MPSIKALASIAPLAALCATGCAALKSTPVDLSDGHAVRSGLHYALPKGLFRIELIRRGDELRVAISEPEYVGDPDASYMLEGSSGLLANQEYLMVVQPETRLLYYVNSSSEGQAGQILQNIVRSGVGARNASEESSRFGRAGRVIYSRVFDPFAMAGCDYGATCDMSALAAELRESAMAQFDCASDDPINPVLCARMEENPNFFRLSLTPMYTPPAGAVRADGDDCRRAICYRAPAPYSFSLRVSGIVDVAEVVSLPNEAPVSALEVPAGVFSDAYARVELYQGMPARYAVDRDNELVAITLLPFTLLKVGFQTVSEVFQFRINYNNNRVNVLESDRRRRAAEDQAQSERDARRAPASSAESFASSSEGSFGEEEELWGDEAESSRRPGGEESSRPMDDETTFDSGGAAMGMRAMGGDEGGGAGALFDVALSADDGGGDESGADLGN
jgi:hypothetical protein